MRAIHKGNKDRAEIDFEKCTSCGRCMRACPFGAVMERSEVLPVLRALASGRHVTALMAPAIVGQFPGGPARIVTALRRLGFSDVMEVALGADVTSQREAAEFVERMERGDTFMTTSCCPAYVEAVRRHAPELLPHVSETATPMHYTAEIARERHPDTVTVFIGPCVAKKKEFQLGRTMNAIDCALTYEELFAMFESRGIDLESLEEAFKDGVKLFLFSNPNNPVGCVYSYEEITGIAALAKKYGVTLIVDELYSRQVYPGIPYTHLCAQKEIPENLITILGPSKTESLSGFRLGAAFGTAEIIERMEKLQAIMALRCSGYNQAVFLTWFHEPDGWLEARVRAHKEIRDAVMEVIREVPGVSAKPTEGGSYLFVTIPELDVSLHQFIRIVRELADVIVTPGTEFGPQYVHQFRINFSQDKEKAAAAMKRLFAVMERYRKQ